MLLHVSAYLFADLDDPAQWRAPLHARGTELGLRGTVLLTPEGINCFVAGPEDGVRAFLAEIRRIPGLAGLKAKESWSDNIGFNRFLVKVKRETITFRRPEFRPAQGRAATVAPRTLARWLDQGHDDEGLPIRMVDTRNAFEVGVGSFEGALDPGIRSFTELPAALEARRGALEGHRVVTFCTGGIRCEKAALWMDRAGFSNVVQLDGGILGYFESVGGRHWNGECFVFDRRVSLTPALEPGTWTQDFDTREVLRPGEPLRPDEDEAA